MKISELIQELQEYLEEHGDLDCMVDWGEYWENLTTHVCEDYIHYRSSERKKFVAFE